MRVVLLWYVWEDSSDVKQRAGSCPTSVENIRHVSKCHLAPKSPTSELAGVRKPKTSEVAVKWQ